jgi:hypothetical protein
MPFSELEIPDRKIYHYLTFEKEDFNSKIFKLKCNETIEYLSFLNHYFHIYQHTVTQKTKDNNFISLFFYVTNKDIIKTNDNEILSVITNIRLSTSTKNLYSFIISDVDYTTTKKDFIKNKNFENLSFKEITLKDLITFLITESNQF